MTKGCRGFLGADGIALVMVAQLNILKFPEGPTLNGM